MRRKLAELEEKKESRRANRFAENDPRQKKAKKKKKGGSLIISQPTPRISIVKKKVSIDMSWRRRRNVELKKSKVWTKRANSQKMKKWWMTSSLLSSNSTAWSKNSRRLGAKKWRNVRRLCLLLPYFSVLFGNFSSEKEIYSMVGFKTVPAHWCPSAVWTGNTRNIFADIDIYTFIK